MLDPADAASARVSGRLAAGQVVGSEPMRLVVFALATLFAHGIAHADSDGVRSAVVLVLNQGPPLDMHPVVRRALLDGIFQGDSEDQLGIVVYGRTASVLVKLRPSATSRRSPWSGPFRTVADPRCSMD